jgi:non-ribosomal peptide synthetase component E (peptide arylation enzyme)
MQRAMLSPLTAMFVMGKDGMAVPTTPTIAVQSRGPLGFREHYRGNDHDEATRIKDALNAEWGLVTGA